MSMTRQNRDPNQWQRLLELLAQQGFEGMKDVLTTLNPMTAQGSGPSHHTVALSNRGNAPVRARLSATDPAGDLEFDIEPMTLEAGPGTAAEAQLRVTPKHRLRRGTATRPFQVVAEAEGYEPLRADEEAQWLARASWRIDTTDGRMLAMGGFDPDVLSWWKEESGSGDTDGRGVAAFSTSPGGWP